MKLVVGITHGNCLTGFPGRKAGASLKPVGGQDSLRGGGCGFPGRKAGASLKHDAISDW